MKSHYLLLASLLGCFLFGGCSSGSNSSNDSESSQEIVLGKIALDNGWARPGSKGEKSAAYLTITNGTTSDDTLVAIGSEVAEKVELHESIENDDGTFSMQPAGRQGISSGSSLQLKPGGMHLMLFNTSRELTAGDSLTLSLQFKNAGSSAVRIPVKLQN